ncbi:hypothetical protein TrST_g6645 [Triparma strigata]|uniref:Phosphoglycerate mutase n=1 Tax=Triparma strigata TaxID=1606541 RepID=A0A9W7AQ58_9STRA|nr:hypothetical protein TrST_g6645 [Triparma strigata]
MLARLRSPECFRQLSNSARASLLCCYSSSAPLSRPKDFVPSTLILLRHGESVWNSQNLYTGWCDVPLTPLGEVEARTAGRLLDDNGFAFDVCHTSVLKRASFTANMALNMANQHYVNVRKTWALNERHYGRLQGYNKDEAYHELGIDRELLMRMRRTWNTAPPAMEDDHPYWHGNDRRYRDLTEQQLESSRGESLLTTSLRCMDYFQEEVMPDLAQGKCILVVSHANSLRSIIKVLDSISNEAIKVMSVPTGIPMIYRLDENNVPIPPNRLHEYGCEPIGYTWGDERGLGGFRGTYLGDTDRLKSIQGKRDLTNRDWQRIILRKVYDEAVNCETENVVETRNLWWALHAKMGESEEYKNMLLLDKMLTMLEEEAKSRKQRYITREGFDAMIKKLHLDSEGQVVLPFKKVGQGRKREEQIVEFTRLHPEAPEPPLATTNA